MRLSPFFELWVDERCVSSLAHSVAGDLPAQCGVRVSPASSGSHTKEDVVLKYGDKAV